MSEMFKSRFGKNHAFKILRADDCKILSNESNLLAWLRIYSRGIQIKLWSITLNKQVTLPPWALDPLARLLIVSQDHVKWLVQHVALLITSSRSFTEVTLNQYRRTLICSIHVLCAMTDIYSTYTSILDRARRRHKHTVLVGSDSKHRWGDRCHRGAPYVKRKDNLTCMTWN